MLPGQLEKVAAYMKVSIEKARSFFCNSPGMLLFSRTRGVFRVRTIVPKFSHGECVFLVGGKCSIHPVAPFGCRYFDVHMDKEEGDRRARWGVLHIFDNEAAYAAERDVLEEAKHYDPQVRNA